jgi:hypothetical protein
MVKGPIKPRGTLTDPMKDSTLPMTSLMDKFESNSPDNPGSAFSKKALRASNALCVMRLLPGSMGFCESDKSDGLSGSNLSKSFDPMRSIKET